MSRFWQCLKFLVYLGAGLMLGALLATNFGFHASKATGGLALIALNVAVHLSWLVGPAIGGWVFFLLERPRE